MHVIHPNTGMTREVAADNEKMISELEAKYDALAVELGKKKLDFDDYRII